MRLIIVVGYNIFKVLSLLIYFFLTMKKTEKISESSEDVVLFMAGCIFTVLLILILK